MNRLYDIGQEIGNQKNEVKGGGDNNLYNYSSSNEDELFKLVPYSAAYSTPDTIQETQLRLNNTPQI